MVTPRRTCCVFSPLWQVELMQDIVFQTEFKDVSETMVTDFASLRQQGDKRMVGFIQALRSKHKRDLDESGYIQEYAASNPLREPVRTVPADAVLRNATIISNYTAGGSTSSGAYIHNFKSVPDNTYTSDHSSNPDPIIKNGGTVAPSPLATTEQVTNLTPATPGPAPDTIPVQAPNQISDIPLDTTRMPAVPAPQAASPVSQFPPTNSPIRNGTDKYNGTRDWNIRYTGPVLMYLKDFQRRA
jgi:hypothetical protein